MRDLNNLDGFCDGETGLARFQKRMDGYSHS